MKQKPNIILIIISLLIVAAGVYWFYFAKTDNDAALTPVVQSSVTQARFQSLLSELSFASFDTRIFSDPRFMGLVDLATPVTPEPQGRIDPFAPLGVGGAPRAATSTVSATTTRSGGAPRP